MHFKLSLIVTLAIGSLTVLGQGADPATSQGGGTDMGAVADDAQKDKCFGLCNDQDIKPSVKCYEKCLKTVLDGGDPKANMDPKVGRPVGTLKERGDCFKKECKKELIKQQGKDCYEHCVIRAAVESYNPIPDSGSPPSDPMVD
ncbi:hypothetical protein LRAMOSA09046 [Lichtheimia ramosa]|uniref:Uncharacterized protein n=1 Tax=Lichtheimia ramosa TaxID=688394 RepID=A0A077WHQ5_9FUNG|nr:hypothetical protein LRAMOSA09046 [Lichtheimia ramosa]